MIIKTFLFMFFIALLGLVLNIYSLYLIYEYGETYSGRLLFLIITTIVFLVFIVYSLARIIHY